MTKPAAQFAQQMIQHQLTQVLTLPQHLNNFITDTFTGRPAFEAATRHALVDSGMSFTVPRLYTNASSADVAPTVADTNEGAAPSETGMTSAYDTVTINKFSGLQRVSFELIDRSSPAFMELMMAELRKAYEKATDTALLTELNCCRNNSNICCSNSSRTPVIHLCRRRSRIQGYRRRLR
jgi:hypothetical protein